MDIFYLCCRRNFRKLGTFDTFRGIQIRQLRSKTFFCEKCLSRKFLPLRSSHMVIGSKLVKWHGLKNLNKNYVHAFVNLGSSSRLKAIQDIHEIPHICKNFPDQYSNQQNIVSSEQDCEITTSFYIKLI